MTRWLRWRRPRGPPFVIDARGSPRRGDSDARWRDPPAASSWRPLDTAPLWPVTKSRFTKNGAVARSAVVRRWFGQGGGWRVGEGVRLGVLRAFATAEAVAYPLAGARRQHDALEFCWSGQAAPPSLGGLSGRCALCACRGTAGFRDGDAERPAGRGDRAGGTRVGSVVSMGRKCSAPRHGGLSLLRCFAVVFVPRGPLAWHPAVARPGRGGGSAKGLGALEPGAAAP